MYLDANGDGVNSADDRLSPQGTQTVVAVFLDTTHNADSTAALCPDTQQPMTINSYEFVLRANGGTVAYGDFVNDRSTMTLAFGARSDSTDFYVGSGGASALEPGSYLLGTVRVTVMSGNPSLGIVTSSALGGTLGTTFGTNCPGPDLDNTYKLGSDWFGVAGCGAPSEGGSAPLNFGPDGFEFVRGMPVALAVEFTDLDQAGATLDVHNLLPGLSAVAGWQVDGKRQIRVYGIIADSVPAGAREDVVWTAVNTTGTQERRTRVTVSSDLRSLGELNARANEIVTKQYSHGLSRLEVRSLGVRILPRLAEMLRDNSYKRHWHKIVTVMGVLGDTAYFDTLHAFIWDRFSGTIDWPTFMAMTTAQGSLSTMATTSPRVRAYLLATATTAAWERLRWTFPENSPGMTAKMLWQSTLGSLCYTDNEEASAFIQQLPTGTTPAERRHSNGLRDAHQRVRQWGYVRLWRENETRSRGGRR